MKRLNLGCGRDYRQGWINVDADKNIKADNYFDLRKKFPFKNGSFDYILAQDVLEHFSKTETKKFLAECGRVLKISGRIKIRTPNIFRIFKQFKRDPEVLIKFIYGDTGQNSDLGSHKYAYTPTDLTKLLRFSGFEIISIRKETTNFVVEAKKIEKLPHSIKVMISLQDAGGMGGAENFLIDLAEALKRKNIDVEFSTWTKSRVSEELKNKKFITHTIPVRMDVIGDIKGLIKFFLFLPFTIFSDYKILKDFKQKGGNVLILSGISDKIVLTPIAKAMRIGILWIEFAPLASVFKRNCHIPKILYRLVKDIPDKVVIPTFYTKAALIPETRISEAKMEIVPCGIKMLDVRSKVYDIRNKKTKTIGMISRIEKGKGQDLLIKAAAKLKLKDFKVVIIGEGETADLRILAEKLGIASKVKLLGYVKRAEDELQAFDVFVFPSTWSLEGFGLVLAEAMNAGVPIVAVDFGPIPEVVGDAACLVKPTPKDLACGIEKVLSDEKYAENLRQEGFSQVKRFDINKIADKYYELLTDCS